MRSSLVVFLVMVLCAISGTRAIHLSGGNGDLLLQPKSHGDNVVVASSNGQPLAVFGNSGPTFTDRSGAPIAVFNSSGIFGCAGCSPSFDSNETIAVDNIVRKTSYDDLMITFPDATTVEFNGCDLADIATLDVTGALSAASATLTGALEGTTAELSGAASATVFNASTSLTAPLIVSRPSDAALTLNTAGTSIVQQVGGTAVLTLTASAATLGTGVVLTPNTATITGSSTSGSARASQALTVTVQRVGNNVYLNLRGLTAAAATNTAVITFTGFITAPYRPASGVGTVTLPMIVTANTATVGAYATISEAGDLVITASAAGGTFTSGQNAGWPRQTLVYSITN